MIMKENVSSFLLALGKYTVKRGRDTSVKFELIDAIKTLTDYDRLEDIYLNETDNYHIPDVAVVHRYRRGYGQWLMNPDLKVTPPYGYDIEISTRCFNKYTDEELGALILHDILHNVLSDTAKLRFIRAWSTLDIEKGDRYMISLENLSSLDVMMYMAMQNVCITPFRVPIMNYDYVAADEVLRAIGLGDAYESYLDKVLPASNNTVEEVMDHQVDMDTRNLRIIMDACLEGQEPGYLRYVHNAMPLISLEKLLNIPRRVDIGREVVSNSYVVFDHTPGVTQKDGGLNESYNNPTSDYELRFSIDKIINSARYAETEAERDVVLFKIKQLSLRVIKIKDKLEKNGSSHRTADRLVLLQEYLDELEQLRKNVMAAEIKEKRWSIYVKGDMPEGYDM